MPGDGLSGGHPGCEHIDDNLRAVGFSSNIHELLRITVAQLPLSPLGCAAPQPAGGCCPMGHGTKPVWVELALGIMLGA